MTQLIETVQLVIETVELVSECSHHWLIESPSGPTSVGTCRACGEIREFKNSLQISSWESEGSHAHRNRTT